VAEKDKIQSVKGMHDILPEDAWLWERVENAYRRIMGLYGYREIRIPVLEKTALFARSIGEETDIVRKEMYTFTDAGSEELSLRPEGTAGVVRAYIQHAVGLQEPVTKLYYLGPMFRRERPQKGRYRQFHQAGSEIFGAPEPLAEVEQILMLRDFFGELGLDRVSFVCNHLGTPPSRAQYTRVLVAFFEKYKSSLCEDCARRLETNPLRILDCKQEGCQSVIARSPSFDAYRPEQSAEQFRRFTEILRDMDVAIEAETRLVRGLDYYTGIVFEGVTGDAGGEAGGGLAVVGGGRYDELVEMLGGPPTPAVGYAIGLERLVEVCRAALGAERNPNVFIITLGREQDAHGMKLLSRLRRRGWRCDFDPRGGSLKSQLKRANKLGASFAVLIGEDEIKAGRVVLRDMAKGEQTDMNETELENALNQRAGLE
jgi:histidyl-tRNA synthetase